MRLPYEYAIIQAMPRIERGELINVGVILYSQRLDFLAARTHLHEDRLRCLDPHADLPAVATALASWEATCTGAGAAATMKPGERFRWLVAPRSTILRAGPVHMGLAADPATELDRLLEVLVR
ncbi:DUF3037 domain-containing protein [Paractinoplanes ferrugineus]|uniref:DUF3037 domain-containing protein n=1 Tax=Paractinoplanes ferrugineus TaxID=113564 RepID=A0A919IUS1_9ACTN|nr:DUF3037 domain-containing protein [Actinoplanes ferrugineus]GIE09355.1 hypothetical protein Afe05nite_11950 [Actinoplanes ferrugineus]